MHDRVKLGRPSSTHTDRWWTDDWPLCRLYIRLSFKYNWLVITPCCLTPQQLNALKPVHSHTHSHIAQTVHTHRKSQLAF